MSYQPIQAVPLAPIGAPSKSRRRLFLSLAATFLVLGLATALALTLVSQNQYSDAVAKLQRAPVGCDTEFDFSETGVFRVYLETKGRVGPLRGDCEGSDTSYARTEGGRPKVSLLLLDEDAAEVTLDRTTASGYDVDGFRGDAFREISIDSPGTYVLRVDSDETDFAVAIGRNPRGDTEGLKQVGLAVGLLGLLLAGLFALLGLRMSAGGAAPTAMQMPSPGPLYGPPGYSPGSMAPPPSATTPMPVLPPNLPPSPPGFSAPTGMAPPPHRWQPPQPPQPVPPQAPAQDADWSRPAPSTPMPPVADATDDHTAWKPPQ